MAITQRVEMDTAVAGLNKVGIEIRAKMEAQVDLMVILLEEYYEERDLDSTWQP